VDIVSVGLVHIKITPINFSSKPIVGISSTSATIDNIGYASSPDRAKVSILLQLI